MGTLDSRCRDYYARIIISIIIVIKSFPAVRSNASRVICVPNPKQHMVQHVRRHRPLLRPPLKFPIKVRYARPPFTACTRYFARLYYRSVIPVDEG